jgi:hypothetical protein
MKFWVPILLLLIVLGIAILLRTRERFSSGAVDPVCSDGLVLVGEKCRGEGSISETGQCPDGTSMNEEGMCQRLEDPRCPPFYTMRVENGVAKCEPENRPAEPSDEEMMAQQKELPSCPAGYQDRSDGKGPNLQCEKDVGEPKCPDNSSIEPTLRGMKCVNRNDGSMTEPQCQSGIVVRVQDGSGRFKCVERIVIDRATGDTIGGATDGPVGGATTGATTDTTERGVTPATVRKNNVLGPVFTSYGSPVDGGDPNTWKSKQYPELLGGGDPAARQREQGAGGGFGFGLGSLTGAMPTAAGLGATEQSRFFPTSRQPGDMELIPDPYRVSQQFSSASYSFKTEPTPFLTDFSAFFR